MTVVATARRPSPLRAWVAASRPATLSAAAVPVAVGSACAFAEGAFAPGPALVALLGALFIQVGTNFANDVFDHDKGADTPDRVGPPRAVAQGWLTPAQMRAGMLAAFGAALLMGAVLTAMAGPAVVVIGVLSIASGIAYTGGPYPLGYHGLGDVFVLVFFGFVAVCGTAWVQSGTVSPLAVWASVPVGGLCTAILVVNNVRDRETDIRAGKHTLAVRLGRRFGVAEHAALLASAYLTPIGLVIGGLASPWALLPLATLPWGASLVLRLARREGAALNPVLAGTARLLLVFGLLFSLGLVVGA